MTTALATYGNQTPSSTLAMADQAVNTNTGTTTSATTTLIGTSTGYGEIPANGTAAAWPALGSLPAQSSKGWLYDTTSLEFQQFIAGNWQWLDRVKISVGTATADLIVRFSKYNAGVYTTLGTITLSGQSLNTTITQFTSALTALGVFNFPNAGDKLYIDRFANITTNGSGSGAATLSLQSCNNAGLGRANNAELRSPGYQPMPILATSPTSLSFSATAGGASPASQNSTLSETAGTGSAWTSSISYGSGSGWLGISPTSDTLTGSGSEPISFTCTTGALTAGTYTATVTFTASNGGKTATVNVTFIVAPAPTGLNVLVAGNPINLAYSSWKLTKQIDQQDRCVLTVIDTTGTANFTKFQTVQVNDSIQGTLWTGYINNPVSTKLPGNAHRLWALDCTDQILLAHNRTSNKIYANQYAGTIFADQIQRYLASEGITGAFALR